MNLSIENYTNLIIQMQQFVFFKLSGSKLMTNETPTMTNSSRTLCCSDYSSLSLHLEQCRTKLI